MRGRLFLLNQKSSKDDFAFSSSLGHVLLFALLLSAEPSNTVASRLDIMEEKRSRAARGESRV